MAPNIVIIPLVEFIPYISANEWDILIKVSNIIFMWFKTENKLNWFIDLSNIFDNDKFYWFQSKHFIYWAFYIMLANLVPKLTVISPYNKHWFYMQHFLNVTIFCRYLEIFQRVFDGGRVQRKIFPTTVITQNPYNFCRHLKSWRIISGRCALHRDMSK